MKNNNTTMTDKMLDIIQAAKDGKQIEYRSRRPDDNCWLLCREDELFDFLHFDYRIKP